MNTSSLNFKRCFNHSYSRLYSFSLNIKYKFLKAGVHHLGTFSVWVEASCWITCFCLGLGFVETEAPSELHHSLQDDRGSPLPTGNRTWNILGLCRTYWKATPEGEGMLECPEDTFSVSNLDFSLLIGLTLQAGFTLRCGHQWLLSFITCKFYH